MAARSRGTLSPLFTWRGAIADSDLPSTARLVAFTLSLYMNEAGDSAFPSVATLARKAGLGTRAVQTHLRTLEDEGWLTTDVGGGKKSNRYTATVPTPAAGAGAQEMHPTPAGDAPEGVIEDVGVVPPPSNEGSGTPPEAAKQDLVFEAVAEAVGVPLDQVPKGKNARGAWNAAVRDLKAEGATPDEIQAVAATYRVTWRGITLTPTALAKHFAQLRAVGVADSLLAEKRARYAAAYRWVEEEGWKLLPGGETTLRENLGRGLGDYADAEALDKLTAAARRIAEA